MARSNVDNNNKTIRYCLKQTQKVSFPGSDTFPHSTKYKNDIQNGYFKTTIVSLKNSTLRDYVDRSITQEIAVITKYFHAQREKNATSNNRILINVFV